MLEPLLTELEKLESKKAALSAAIIDAKFQMWQRLDHSKLPNRIIDPLLEASSFSDWQNGPKLFKQDGPEFFPRGTDIDALRELNFTLLPDGLPAVSMDSIRSLRSYFAQVAEITEKATLVRVCVDVVETTSEQEEALLECLRLICNLWDDPLDPVNDPEKKILFARNLLKLSNVTPPPIGELPRIEPVEVIKDRKSHIHAQWVRWENTFCELLKRVEDGFIRNNESTNQVPNPSKPESKIEDDTPQNTPNDSRISDSKKNTRIALIRAVLEFHGFKKLSKRAIAKELRTKGHGMNNAMLNLLIDEVYDSEWFQNRPKTQIAEDKP